MWVAAPVALEVWFKVHWTTVVRLFSLGSQLRHV